MTYATQQNMIDRFTQQELIELTDSANLGVIDTVALGAALADASAEMDGYLAGVVVLPMAVVPLVLVGYCADIARYKLYDQAAPEQVRRRYEDAIKFLAMVGTGKLSLGLDAGNAAAAPSGGVKSSAAARVFNAGSLADY